MDLKLNGKVVFVTASGQGIGLAVASCFLDEGAKVVINDNDKIKLKRTLLRLKRNYRDRVGAFYGDVTKESDILTAKEYLINKWGHVDILVANLGVGKPMKDDKIDPEEWQRFFNINILSSVKLVKAFLPEMKLRCDGSIILISSIVGLERTSAPWGYAAAKSAILSFSKNLSAELGEYNIRVNAIVPGNIYFKGGRWEELVKSKPNLEKEIKKNVPLRRFGNPEEIANSVVFLSSPVSSFTTGAYLVIDGGETRRN